MKRKWFKRTDILIICALLAVCGIVMLLFAFLRTDSAAVTAIITNDDKQVMEISLNATKDKIFTLPQNKNVSFQVKASKIRFVDVNCPDKLCENFGYLSNPGDMAICLPNKVILRLVGDSKSEIDAIVN